MISEVGHKAGMLPRTKYARSEDVCIAYQITGDGPFDIVMARHDVASGP